MASLEVQNLQKKKVGSVTVADDFFPQKTSMALIKQVVNWQRAGRRAGTASVKARNAVRGTTAKMYRQKGTGNARHGDKKAPIFVGGGQAFGPHPRDWSQALPKKMRRQAIRAILGEKHENEKLFIVDAVEFKEIKTKRAIETFKKMGIGNALVILDKQVDSVVKSLRNVPGYKVSQVDGLNAIDLLAHDYLVITQAAFEKVQEFLTGASGSGTLGTGTKVPLRGGTDPS
jgi:large subunit ribosomal protein L4